MASRVCPSHSRAGTLFVIPIVEPDEIARMIGHAVENEAINATTIEVTGGLCYPGGIAK